MSHTPSVLFVCVKNGGKSQIAAALTTLQAHDRIRVFSAGTAPGTTLNTLAVDAVTELGADMSHATPQAVTPELLHRVDRIIILGEEAQLAVPATVTAPVERWLTDEPSTRGIEGMERMRLVRDDINARVAKLIVALDSR